MFSLESPQWGDSNGNTQHTFMLQKIKEILIMPPDLALLSTLIGSNYPCLELIFVVPEVFEPLKFDCIYKGSQLLSLSAGSQWQMWCLQFGQSHKKSNFETEALEPRLSFAVSHFWQWAKMLISGGMLVAWALNSVCLLIYRKFYLLFSERVPGNYKLN